jgi:hypothetical protein
VRRIQPRRLLVAEVADRAGRLIGARKLVWTLTASFAIMPLPFFGPATAEGLRLGVEYEFEKDRRSGIRNHEISLEPGWEFPKSSPIDLIELLIERNRDARADADGFRSRETKVFLRLRHTGELTRSSSYYVQGGAGRSFNNEKNFWYAYIEPGLTFELSERWEWMFGVRVGDSIDGTYGERVLKYIIGPSFAIDKRNEIEMRYFRARRDEDAWSVSIGYTHRF